ncbi:MAG TPA: GNAT family N-acetyltransferase [Solirubrobacterales bacterium]
MEPGEWRIAPGTEADIAAVLALWDLVVVRPSATDTGEGLAILLRQDPGALLIARADGDAIGSLIAAWDGWRGSFYRLAVHPKRRREGVAASLVEAGERRLRELGARRVTAIVFPEDGEDAPALWKALGYEMQAGAGRLVRMLY